MTTIPATAKITVTLEQPVAAGTGPRPDYRNPTHNYISGAVLRGACAAEWIRRLGPPEPSKPRTEAKELQRTRAGLDLDGVARSGMLFRTDALADSQVFTGWVSGPAIEAFFPDHTTIEFLRLGGDRSTNGLVRVQVDRAAQPDLLEGNDRSVVLRLAAPGIFIDEAGLPAKVPDPAELAEALGVATATVAKSWTRWGEAAGWHGASGLPKPTERCVTAGSTYLVDCDQAPTDDALRRLRVRGVGLRRREGFGALCPPITPPVPLALITGRLAALRAESDFAELVRRLRDRSPRLEGQGPEDPHLVARLDQLTDPSRTALRTLLEMDDVALYREALDYLDPGKATR